MESHIQVLLSEIEFYCSQGLFEEAKDKCSEMEELIQQSQHIRKKEKLLAVVSKKLDELETERRRFEIAGAPPLIYAKDQGIIEKLFDFSKAAGPDSAALQGAVALLVFGQFEKALKEFDELIKKDSLRFFAAKSILRCHIGLSSLDDAVMQYGQWLSSGQFSSRQLNRIRSFLKEILEKKGMDRPLPKPEEITGAKEHAIGEEEFIDILSILIPWSEDAAEGKGMKLDVSFQKGNRISVIIPGSTQALLDRLKIGSILHDVQFYSPAVTFKEACVVSAKRQIQSGPKEGDYTFLLEILDG